MINHQAAADSLSLPYAILALGQSNDPTWGIDSTWSDRLYQRKALKVIDTRGRLALKAAWQAVEQATLDYSKPSFRRGISLAVGSATMGEEDLRQAFQDGDDLPLVEKLNQHLNPLWILGRLPNIPASHLAIQFKCQGPVLTCLTVRQALSDALDILENNEADCLLVGVSDRTSTILILATLEFAEAHKSKVFQHISRKDYWKTWLELAPDNIYE